MTPEKRAKLILRHQKLVHHVIKKQRYKPPWGATYEDLFHEGMLGLMVAVDRYDPSRGSFSHFAYVCIRNAILRYLRRELSWWNHALLLDNPVYPDADDGDGDNFSFYGVLTGVPDFSEEIVTVLDVNKAISKMSPDDRRVLSLHARGVPQKKIAELLGVNQATVCRWLQRLHKDLAS